MASIWDASRAGGGCSTPPSTAGSFHELGLPKRAAQIRKQLRADPRKICSGLGRNPISIRVHRSQMRTPADTSTPRSPAKGVRSTPAYGCNLASNPKFKNISPKSISPYYRLMRRSSYAKPCSASQNLGPTEPRSNHSSWHHKPSGRPLFPRERPPWERQNSSSMSGRSLPECILGLEPSQSSWPQAPSSFLWMRFAGGFLFCGSFFFFFHI